MVESENIAQLAVPPVPEVAPVTAKVGAEEIQKEHHQGLQRSLGNASLAAAATGESSPPHNNNHSGHINFNFGNTAIARMLIQRKVNDAAPTSPPATATVAPVTPGVPQTQLIIEDSGQLDPGQLKKTEFLTQLRTSVSKAAAEAFAGTPWTEAGCPYIDRVFAYCSTLDSERLERGIRKYAPDTSNATTAAALIPIITARVQRALTTWVRTGQITEVPEGVPLSLLTSGVVGAIGGALAGIRGGANQLFAGAKSGLSGFKSLLFKQRNDGPAEPSDPAQIQSQLGNGDSLDGGVRSRMESAFGESFNGVQVHTDRNAGELSKELNARAFTVGQNIAFGTGEYQPGTIIGDALIAHELAHVMQQRNGDSVESPAQVGANADGGLEEAADMSAMRAVLSLWSGNEKRRGTGARTLPALRSGLRLQRCDDEPSRQPVPAPTPAPPPAPQPPPPPSTLAGQFPADCTNRAALQAVIDAHPNYTQWEIELIREGDNFERIAARVVARRPDLFVGRRAIYALEVSGMYGGSIRVGRGRYIVLPVGWRDPNVGTLPTAPSTFTPSDPATQAIAVVYGEQTLTSAQAQEQQRYIWFSIRKRIGSSRYPPNLAGVLTQSQQYNAFDEADYHAALTDLTSGAPPRIPGVANAKRIVLDNWTTAIPANAGAGYFHWRVRSTPNTTYNSLPHGTPAEALAAEKRAAWRWATTIRIAGNVPEADGWFHRIRGDNDGPIGSMYIYPGEGD